METDWHWKSRKNNLKKEGKKYELWRFWWAICTTTIKKRIK